MQATRRARIESAILEELSRVVPREIKDPRIPSVTFTAAELTTDASQATVYVFILGAMRSEIPEQEKAKRMKACLEGLTSASGFLRRHLAKALTIRHIPTLIFREDKGLENASRVYELLKKISTEPSSG
jgi:ribosome-binding factor A